MDEEQKPNYIIFNCEESSITGIEGLDAIFNPRSIAVIGANDTEGSIGYRLLNNLIGVGYKGCVYPVNPFYPSVQGITAYPSVKKIPWPIDLAIIAVPARLVPQIVEECGQSGITGIIIVSSGFSEIGPKGRALEEELLILKRIYNLRIIGPSSLGVIRPHTRLYAAFAKKVTNWGKVAFISQSGALCVSVLDWAAHAKVGFSCFVSVGSMIDVDFADLIDYFGTDPETSSIILFIESITDAPSFMSAARRFAGTKPIIVIKAGKTSEGTQAALSHTGAIAGEDAIYDAAFKRAGIIRVEAIVDLFSCSEILAMQPTPKGSNLAIITNAGGPSIMATDFLISKGGKLAPLSEETVGALEKILPPYWSRSNPIDICEDATVATFRKVLEIRFEDPQIDGFLIIYSPMGIADPVEIAQMLVQLSKKTKKPLLTTLLGEEDVREAREILRRNSIPTYATPEQAISTFLYMYQYTKNCELLYETPEELPISLEIDQQQLQTILRRAVEEDREILTEPESKEFLEAYGIPTAKTAIARTAQEAAKIAVKIGFPIVLKILSPQITHKTDVGGVILNLNSESEVRHSCDALFARMKKRYPGITIEGVTVQPMLSNGYEFIFGSKKDPQFGSILIFGLGGSDVELLSDVTIGFPPLNQILARRMIEQIRTYNRLQLGFRGRPPLNTRLLEESLVRFSQLIVDFPQIKEIDVNPILVNEQSITALDARVILDLNKVNAEVKPYEHLIIRPYPKKYVVERTLRDGCNVLLRPIKPEDETLLVDLFQTFSNETMHLRFFQSIKDISHRTLVQHCNIDYDREMVIVAELVEEGKRHIIGMTSVIIEPDGECGEITVVVGDPWQNRGCGTMLFDYIIEISRDMKLKRVFGEILNKNRIMIRMCQAKGFIIRPIDHETCRATLNLQDEK